MSDPRHYFDGGSVSVEVLDEYYFLRDILAVDASTLAAPTRAIHRD